MILIYVIGAMSLVTVFWVLFYKKTLPDELYKAMKALYFLKEGLFRIGLLYIIQRLITVKYIKIFIYVPISYYVVVVIHDICYSFGMKWGLVFWDYTIIISQLIMLVWSAIVLYRGSRFCPE